MRGWQYLALTVDFGAETVIPHMLVQEHMAVFVDDGSHVLNKMT